MSPEPYERFRDEFVALDPERYPADYIDRQVWTGAWRCFGNGRAAMIVEIKAFPSGAREAHVWGAAKADDATLEDIVALKPFAEEYGRLAGCRWASVESHPAWARLLPDYEPSQLRLVKEL